MNNLSQFKDLSSWRTNDITIKSGEVGTIDYLDTKPNQFIVQNPNNAYLYIGLANIPTEKSYEYKIAYNVTAPLGRPIPTNKMYIFNSSSEEITVRVFSVYMPFDMATLAQSNINVESANIMTDGIVRGFASGLQLPAGGNTIGAVEMGTQFKSVINSILNNIIYNPNSDDETLTLAKNIYDISHILSQAIAYPDTDRDTDNTLIEYIDSISKTNDTSRDYLSNIKSYTNSIVGLLNTTIANTLNSINNKLLPLSDINKNVNSFCENNYTLYKTEKLTFSEYTDPIMKFTKLTKDIVENAKKIVIDIEPYGSSYAEIEIHKHMIENSTKFCIKSYKTARESEAPFERYLIFYLGYDNNNVVNLYYHVAYHKSTSQTHYSCALDATNVMKIKTNSDISIRVY